MPAVPKPQHEFKRGLRAPQVFSEKCEGTPHYSTRKKSAYATEVKRRLARTMVDSLATLVKPGFCFWSKISQTGSSMSATKKGLPAGVRGQVRSPAVPDRSRDICFATPRCQTGWRKCNRRGRGVNAVIEDRRQAFGVLTDGQARNSTARTTYCGELIGCSVPWRSVGDVTECFDWNPLRRILITLKHAARYGRGKRAVRSRIA